MAKTWQTKTEMTQKRQTMTKNGRQNCNEKNDQKIDTKLKWQQKWKQKQKNDKLVIFNFSICASLSLG